MSYTLQDLIAAHVPANARRKLAMILDAPPPEASPGPHLAAPARCSLAAWLAKSPLGPRLVPSRPDRLPGHVAFVPASMLGPVRLSLPATPDLIGTTHHLPVVASSREERRLAQRRVARTRSEDERNAGIARIEACIAQGGLWRREDIASAAAVHPAQAAGVIEALSRSGSIVPVALGYWRSRVRSADVAADARCTGLRVLGSLILGVSMSVEEIASFVGITTVEADAALGLLRAEGLSEPVGGRNRCPPSRAANLVASLGPAPLTPLGERVLDCISNGGPARKIEIAERLAMGRGSVNRVVERLLEEGWVERVDGERFRLA